MPLTARRNSSASSRPSSRRGSRLSTRRSVGQPQSQSHAVVPLALAYEAVMRALPSASEVAGRAAFVALAGGFEVTSRDGRSDQAAAKLPPQLLALVLVLTRKLSQDRAPKLKELVANPRSSPADSFQDALVDAEVLGVDASVWRPTLCVQSGLPGVPAQLSTDMLHELFGGGAAARLPDAAVSEALLMHAATAGLQADFQERTGQLQRLWERQPKAKGGGGALPYADIQSTLLSAEPTLPLPLVRALYLGAVEASRSCTRLQGRSCQLLGTLEPDACGECGGELVTLQLLRHTALKHSLFLQDSVPRRSQTPRSPTPSKETTGR